MLTIEADYIGGDPDMVGLIGASGELQEDNGVFTYRQTTDDVRGLMASSGKKRQDKMTYTVGEVLTVAAGDANHMRMLTRVAVGEALGGGIGGLIGAASGKRNHELALICRRDGFDFMPTFRVTPEDSRRFIDTLQRERRERGERPLPSAEEVLGVEAATARGGDGDAATLSAIQSLLVDQNTLLSQILTELKNSRA